MAPSVRKSSVDACPDLETLAGYLDGRLTERERADIAAHVAGCETCYFVFTEAAQTRASDRARAETDASASPEAVTAPTPKWMTPKVMWSSATALAALAATLLIAIRIVGRPLAGNDSELRSLVAAVGTDRRIEPRLTGGFAYGSLRGPLRSGSAAVEPSADVQIAVAQIEKHNLGGQTAQAKRLLGLAYLLSGNVDRATTTLEEAAGQTSADARVFSDLAAAYLARASVVRESQDVTKALAAAGRAIAADPALTEAWFNRALALEKLQLEREARTAWQEYLRLDQDSQWADEARDHLRGRR